MTTFNGKYQSPRKSDGTINSGGKVYFYATGTSTLKAVYTDENASTAHTNPVVLDANGSALIFLGGGSYDYKVDDSSDSAVVALQGPVTGAAAVDSIKADPSLLVNGDFSDVNTSTNHPNNWTITEDAGGTVAVIAGDGYPDGNALQFTGTGSGGGSAESSKIPIAAYDRYNLSFRVSTTADGTTNTVKVNLYDKDDLLQHTYTAWSRENYALSNALIRYTFDPTANSETTVTYARIFIDGVDDGGADAAGSSIFYGFYVTFDRTYPFPLDKSLLKLTRPSSTQVKVQWQSIGNAGLVTGSKNIAIDVTGSITSDLKSGESEANSTWYQVWLISDGETTQVRFLTDTTGALLGSSDDKYYSELVGYAYNDSSGNFIDFIQHGDLCILQEEIEDRALADLDNSWTTVTPNMPSQITLGLFNFTSYGNGAGAVAYLEARRFGSGSGSRVGGSGGTSASVNQAWVELVSNRIDVRHSVSSSHQCRVATAGFKVYWES